MDQKHTVIIQCWEIDGVPNGYSMHMNESDRKDFTEKVNEYFESFPEDERSIPSGEPYESEVVDDVFKRVKASRCGINGYPDYVPC